jgi:beta-lactamase regulating signal transducer with metallopeptidase domain
VTLRLFLGLAPPFVAVALAMSFTYAVHALVWWGAAQVALSRGGRSPAARHQLWKWALLGPIATAPIAALAPWNLERMVASRAVSLLPLPTAGRPEGPSSWASWLALAMGIAVGLGFLRFAIAFVRLRRRLRHRTRVRDARLLALFDRVCARAELSSVCLTESGAITSPLVIGTRELCVPRFMAQQLGETELVAVLGHELAHVERRDGVWFPIAGLLRSALWMQPLNHWIAARFRETAELACDDRAVELCGDRSGLARALVRMAESAMSAQQGELMPGMAGAAGVLRSRVERLAAPIAGRPLRAVRAPARASLIASLGMGAIASLAFSVRVAQPPRLAEAHDPVAPAAAGPSSQRLAELVDRDRKLQQQLAQAGVWGEGHPDDRNFAAWKSDLEQELRHVRAEATWTERSLGTDARPLLTAH